MLYDFKDEYLTVWKIWGEGMGGFQFYGNYHFGPSIVKLYRNIRNKLYLFLKQITNRIFSNKIRRFNIWWIPNMFYRDNNHKFNIWVWSIF